MSPVCTCRCECATITNWKHAPRRFCGCCPNDCSDCSHERTDVHNEGAK